MKSESFKRKMNCINCNSPESINYKVGLKDDGIWIKVDKCTNCNYMPAVNEILKG